MVPLPPALRSEAGLRSRLGGLWSGCLRALDASGQGRHYSQLARIDRAVVEDLKRIKL